MGIQAPGLFLSSLFSLVVCRFLPPFINMFYLSFLKSKEVFSDAQLRAWVLPFSIFSFEMVKEILCHIWKGPWLTRTLSALPFMAFFSVDAYCIVGFFKLSIHSAPTALPPATIEKADRVDVLING